MATSNGMALLDRIASLGIPSKVIVAFFEIGLALPSTAPFSLVTTLVTLGVSRSTLRIGIGAASLPVSGYMLASSLVPSAIVRRTTPPSVTIPSIRSTAIAFSVIALSFPVFGL